MSNPSSSSPTHVHRRFTTAAACPYSVCVGCSRSDEGVPPDVAAGSLEALLFQGSYGRAYCLDNSRHLHV